MSSRKDTKQILTTTISTKRKLQLHIYNSQSFQLEHTNTIATYLNRASYYYYEYGYMWYILL